MLSKLLFVFPALVFSLWLFAQTAHQPSVKINDYVSNRAPLHKNPYMALPIGAIKPTGWLKEMLLRQKTGATGNLDSLYPSVMGKRNGWLGGDGDQWERGPYWIDGLLPLAYLLNDENLIKKTKPWVEWALNSLQPDGYFGPSHDYPNEPGLQRTYSRDWWPKMVMLKILQQYYSATNDQRVIKLLTSYFKYQLKMLPTMPLDHWTFWAAYRGGDNLAVVYWLYNITGDTFLLTLGDLIHRQTFDYSNAFLNTNMLSSKGSIHCVNLAQGIKEPIIYYQHHPEQQYIDATHKAYEDLMRFNGMAHGMYGGDEALHGNNPTQGSELCSAVEMMFSLESILPVTGEVTYADRLEKIAFNALPAQVTDDFMTRQYYQQANQVTAARSVKNFSIDHDGTDVCFGLLTGFPCCTSNMHQGWPKFTQNLWYATPEKGIAALVYAPSQVNAVVADGKAISVIEQTAYPFEESIWFTISFEQKNAGISFPFHLRIPTWCNNAIVKINGVAQPTNKAGTIAVLNRVWRSGDVVELSLPMQIFKTNWYENSAAIERGPLTFALKIEETRKLIVNKRDSIYYGNTYYEVSPASQWNFGLIDLSADKLQDAFTLTKKTVSDFPWNPENAPLQLKTKAKVIPSWTLYNQMAGPMPFSITYGLETQKEEKEITLIPYGCTNLRISQFPVTDKQ